MRTKFIQAWLCLLLLNGLIPPTLVSQTNFSDEFSLDCTANRSFEMVKNVRYSISSETLVEEISNYDLVLARGYDNVLEVFQCVKSNGSLATSTNYLNPAHNPDSWQPQIYRSVMDENGAKFYNDEGELLYQSSNQMANAIEAEEVEILEEDKFGTRDIIPQFQLDEYDFMEGELTLYADGSYTIMEEDAEITYDPTKQSIVTRLFEEGSLSYLHEQYFTEVSQNRIIPKYEIIRTYNSLINGGWMEKSEIRTYKNYKVNGELMGSQEIKITGKGGMKPSMERLGTFEKSVLEKNKRLKMFPNPAQNWLTILHDEGIQEVKVLNNLGVTIATFNGRGEHTMKISITNLIRGTYVLEVCTPTGQVFKQFIKN